MQLQAYSVAYKGENTPEKGDAMPEFSFITVNKAKTLLKKEKVKVKGKRKKSSVIEEYEKYLRNLERGKAIGIMLKEDDKFQTIKYRLKRAAISLGIQNLKIERAGDKVIVYREIKPRTRKAEERTMGPRPVRDEPVEELSLEEPDFEASPQLDLDVFGPSPVAPPPPAAQPEAEPVFEPASAQPATPAPDTSPAPQQDGESLEFDEEWQELMVRGHKTCLTRAEKYGSRAFEAFGDEYVITKVEHMTLGDIAEKRFKEHGFYSPREFREVWKKSHRGNFDPEQKVWLHHFKKAFELSDRPDADAYPG
jgi:hypothetical protein